MDEQIMSWATSRPEVICLTSRLAVINGLSCLSPHTLVTITFTYVCVCVCVGFLQDWHLGGKCDVYLWGAGRHGQLAEAGRNILVPTAAPSFSQAQQVR